MTRRAISHEALAVRLVHPLDYASMDCADESPGPSTAREFLEMVVGMAAAVLVLLAILSIPALVTHWD